MSSVWYCGDGTVSQRKLLVTRCHKTAGGMFTLFLSFSHSLYINLLDVSSLLSRSLSLSSTFLFQFFFLLFFNYIHIPRNASHSILFFQRPLFRTLFFFSLSPFTFGLPGVSAPPAGVPGASSLGAGGVDVSR